MSDKAKQLVERCQQLHQGAGDAIEWIQDVRPSSQRLDNDSDGLILKMRKVRNLVKRLGRAASRPMSVGFFGISQAGKSYLISALAAGVNGKLETVLDGQRLDFIDHVNPPGGGKEATGLVTRFTRQSVDAPAGYPIQLTLFKEADLVKVLGNAYFNDFDHKKLSFQSDPAEVRQSILAPLEQRAQLQPLPGMTEDDVVDLMDYFVKRVPNLMESLQGDYWPTAIELAPRLRPEDRSLLFSVLWGRIHELSMTFLELRQALDDLGHAETAYCQTSALVSETATGQLSQADSIMNVDILDRLGSNDSHDSSVEVVPRSAEGLSSPVSLPRSVLAALTTELCFVLAEPPAATTVEQVDLLDFPGYRGRLEVTDIREIKGDDGAQASPVAQLLLRGKVACLFERYTDDQEMNVMVLCTPSDKQSDVNSIGPVLDTWINATQGSSPEVRARRVPGLAWAMTRFDNRIKDSLGDSEENARIKWDGMMKLVLERFKRFEWVHNWGPEQPFNNTFLVRKPRMLTPWLDLSNDEETGISASQQDKLAMLRQTFVTDPTVVRHFVDPGEDWDAMARLNDGGISRLADYLASAARIELKFERIQEQLDEEASDISENRLGSYYHQEGAAEVEKKQQIIAAVKKELTAPSKLARFGELLKYLQPSTEQLRARYLRTENDPPVAEGTGQASEAESQASEDFGGLFGLDDLGFAPDPDSMENPLEKERKSRNLSSSAVKFSRAALRDWTGQIRGLSENLDLIHFLAVDPKVLRQLVDELVTGADRLGIEARIAESIQEAEVRTSATRSSLVERQVMTVANRLNDFIDYLGFSSETLAERPRSVSGGGRAVFQLPPLIPAGQLPQLAPKPLNFSGLFVVDWLEAFADLAINNAGHTAGREITPEQNERLGQVLVKIKHGLE